MRTRIRVRAFVSFLTTFSFLAMAFSGVVLYVAPRGREANWGGWRLLGLGKHTWGGVHMTVSLLFVLAAAAHVYFNRKVLWSYVRRRTQGAMSLTGELALALAVTGLVVVGTIAAAPPFRAILRWNDDIKAYWARSSARAPVPHAEELSLAQFAEHIGLTTDETTAALRKEGFAVADPSMTVGQLASQKGVSPEDVFAAIRKHHPEARARRGYGGGRGGGAGGRGGGARRGGGADGGRGGGGRRGQGPGPGG